MKCSYCKEEIKNKKALKSRGPRIFCGDECRIASQKSKSWNYRSYAHVGSSGYEVLEEYVPEVNGTEDAEISAAMDEYFAAGGVVRKFAPMRGHKWMTEEEEETMSYFGGLR